jgi:hypothetical protein
MSKARDIASAAPAPSTVSATELGYLDGVTSAIQTQLDAKTAKSTLTTTGDIYYASAANTPARLGIGTASQILAVNSGATAPEWVAAPAAGAEPLLIPINSGSYVKGFQIAALNQAGLTEDRTYYIPIYLTGTTYDRIGFKSGASQTSASTIRLGIYNVGANNRPTTLVLDAGTVSANAANTVFQITISQALNAGYYYLAINYQAGVQAYAMYISDPVFPTGGYGSDMNSQSINNQMYYETGVTGAFATAGTLVASNDQFFMGMRIA